MSDARYGRGADMPTPAPTHRDYARWARLEDAELARACTFEAFHASGPGGQGVNTADSAVRLRHMPSGVTVTSREHRSQLQNRAACLRKLRRILTRRATPPKVRVATKPTRASKERRLADKRRRGDVKASRRRPTADE